MTTIWKFPFEVSDEVVLMMPLGSRVIHVECQGGVPCLWAVVDPAQTVFRRRLRIYGTGHELPYDMENERDGDDIVADHIGTFQQGPFVWHVFEM